MVKFDPLQKLLYLSAKNFPFDYVDNPAQHVNFRNDVLLYK